jgi:hypothetical protein
VEGWELVSQSLEPDPVKKFVAGLAAMKSGARRNLDSYVETPTRDDQLTSLQGSSELRALELAVSRLVSGGATQAVAKLIDELWKAVVLPGVPGDLVVYDGGTDVTTSPWLDRLGKGYLAQEAAGDYREWIPGSGGGISFSTVPVALVWAEAPMPTMTTAQNFVLRIAFDVCLDQAGSSSRSSPLPRRAACCAPWWLGVRARVAGARRSVPWPMPGWPTGLEWELFMSLWAKALQSSRMSWLDEPGEARKRKLVDGLASHFLRMTRLVALDGGMDPTLIKKEIKGDFPVEMSVDDWGTAARRMLDGFTTMSEWASPHHSWTAADWSARGVLLAAPESALMPASGGAILDTVVGYFQQNGLIRKFPEGTGYIPYWAYVQKLRRERLVFAGAPESEVDAELQAIDDAHPDHPWIKHFKNLPPEAASAK